MDLELNKSLEVELTDRGIIKFWSWYSKEYGGKPLNERHIDERESILNSFEFKLEHLGRIFGDEVYSNQTEYIKRLVY